MLKKWYTVCRNRTRFLRYLTRLPSLGGTRRAAQVLCCQLLGRVVPETGEPDKCRQPVGHLCRSENRRNLIASLGTCTESQIAISSLRETNRHGYDNLFIAMGDSCTVSEHSLQYEMNGIFYALSRLSPRYYYGQSIAFPKRDLPPIVACTRDVHDRIPGTCNVSSIGQRPCRMWIRLMSL